MQYVARYSSWFEDDFSHAHMSQKKRAGKGKQKKIQMEDREERRG